MLLPRIDVLELFLETLLAEQNKRPPEWITPRQRLQ